MNQQSTTAQVPTANSSSSGYDGLPPDAVILVVALFFFQAFEWLHRRRLGPRFASYVRLPFRDRFDWDRRIVNVLFQIVQLLSNTYILFFDGKATSDYLYGYSRTAHLSFVIIIAFYVYDTIGIVMHPSPGSTYVAWIVHHLVAAGLLLFNVSYKRSSAFPAAAFLISAGSHIPNELRWFCAATGVRNQAVINLTLLSCLVLPFYVLILPPLYLLWKGAGQLNISLFELVTTRMRAYCIFFFLLIFIPHVGLVISQVFRVAQFWGKPVEPFRTRKVD